MVFFKLLFALIGCEAPSEGPQDSAQEATEFACDLRLGDGSGNFVDATDAAPAELVLGFQGFLFVELQFRAAQGSPSPVLVKMSLEMEGDSPLGSSQPDVDLEPQEDGSLLSEEVKLFLPSNEVGHYKDQDAALTTLLESEDATQFCLAQYPIFLVDDDPCIHTGGEPICPEDTGEGQ